MESSCRDLSSTIPYQLVQVEDAGQASAWPHQLTCHYQRQSSTMVSLSPSIYYPQFQVPRTPIAESQLTDHLKLSKIFLFCSLSLCFKQQGTRALEQMPYMGDQESMPCEQVEMAIPTTDITPDAVQWLILQNQIPLRYM